MKLDDVLGFKIYKVFSLLKNRVFHKFYENEFDVNFEQWIILNRLWDNDKQAQGSLLETTMQSKGNFTRTLKKMEESKLILKKINVNDQRSCTIHLTKKGNDSKKNLRKLAYGELSKALIGISKEEILITQKVLLKMENNLQKVNKL